MVERTNTDVWGNFGANVVEKDGINLKGKNILLWYEFMMYVYVLNKWVLNF